MATALSIQSCLWCPFRRQPPEAAGRTGRTQIDDLRSANETATSRTRLYNDSQDRSSVGFYGSNTLTPCKKHTIRKAECKAVQGMRAPGRRSHRRAADILPPESPSNPSATWHRRTSRGAPAAGPRPEHLTVPLRRCRRRKLHEPDRRQRQVLEMRGSGTIRSCRTAAVLRCAIFSAASVTSWPPHSSVSWMAHRRG